MGSFAFFINNKISLKFGLKTRDVLDYIKDDFGGSKEKALNYFDDKCSVIIFSDDPDWCNQQEIFSDSRFLVAEGNSNYVDLCLMTLSSRVRLMRHCVAPRILSVLL